MNLAPPPPTPKDTVFRDGTAQLYRFRPVEGARRPADGDLPLLLVPSLINRWYIVDLRKGGSIAGACVEAGLDTFCLDWGIPNDEDRYFTWDDVLTRLARTVRRVKSITGAPRVGLLGYCVGGTLSAIHTSLHPDDVAALVNLAGPVDFSNAGRLGHMVDPRWFDADAIANAGNVTPPQMQAGFVSLRPTAQLGKWVTLADRVSKAPGPNGKPGRDAFWALEGWASDNIPFPAAAYRRYIKELYQDNQLVRGEHRIRGQRVDLGAIRCPVMTVATERDEICPPAAASALNERCGSEDKRLLMVPGGHVGAVVGGRARDVLYPEITQWLRSKLHATEGPESHRHGRSAGAGSAHREAAP